VLEMREMFVQTLLSGPARLTPSRPFLLFVLCIGRSPADSLTYNITSHLLTIAGKRPTVRQQVLDSIWAYLDKLASFIISDNGMCNLLTAHNLK
jgi:hypothetical protein